MSLARISNTWRTTTFRLTLIYGLLFFVGTTVLLAFIYLESSMYFTQQMDQILRVEIAAYSSASPNQLPTLIDEDVQRDTRHINLYGLFTSTGQRLAGNLLRVPDKLEINGNPANLATSFEETEMHRKMNIHMLSKPLSDGSLLVIGRYNTHMQEIRHIILLALLGAAVIVIAVTVIGVFISIRPLNRINDIQLASEIIMQGDIYRRLPVAGKNDELDMLAHIINRMLDELERLIFDVKSATDRVAHDLRTPLTRLRAMLYRAQMQMSAGIVNKEILERSVTETDALLARFRALMRVSEISSLTRRAGFGMIDLKPILQQVQDLYAPLADEKHIKLSSRLPDHIDLVQADGGLLFEAVANLVDNAIKFTPANGSVDIILTAGSHGPQIDIIDNGPGISPNEIALMIQPFYRGKHAHQPNGYGLGLSIVTAIMQLHDFRLTFASEGQGTRASIECWRSTFPPAAFVG